MNVCVASVLSENQKKKNQDESDEEDDDEAGPSFQQPVAPPQPAYVPPMTQPGMMPGTRPQGMPPANYSGTLSGARGEMAHRDAERLNINSNAGKLVS